MDKKEFTYEINGKTYFQRPLVLGQIKQLFGVLKGVEIAQDMGIKEIMRLLGDRLPDAIAVVLTEKGTKIKDKDLQALADEMREFMDIGTATEVFDHLLSLNPIASVIEKLTGIMTTMMVVLKKPASSSPEETSQGKMQSSEDIP